MVLDGITAKEDLFKKEAEEKEKVSLYLHLHIKQLIYFYIQIRRKSGSNRIV
jgi:hypothetical protein